MAMAPRPVGTAMMGNQVKRGLGGGEREERDVFEAGMV